MFYQGPATKRYLEECIQDTEKRLIQYKKLMDELSFIKITEVAIRKSDSVLVSVIYKIDNTPAIVVETTPMGGASGVIISMSVSTFQSDYVEYSKKTRHLFPKKGKKL